MTLIPSFLLFYKFRLIVLVDDATGELLLRSAIVLLTSGSYHSFHQIHQFLHTRLSLASSYLFPQFLTLVSTQSGSFDGLHNIVASQNLVGPFRCSNSCSTTATTQRTQSFRLNELPKGKLIAHNGTYQARNPSSETGLDDTRTAMAEHHGASW